MLVPAVDGPTMVFVSWHGCCSIEEAGTWLCLDHEHNTGQVTELSLLLYRGETVFCWFGRCHLGGDAAVHRRSVCNKCHV